MDPITHGLSGVVIRNFGFRRRAALGVLVFSAMAPDLDYISRAWGIEAFLRYHRGITHGVLALLVVPLVVGIVVGRKKEFAYYAFIASLGYGLHMLLDLTNQYGTRVMSPLDWQPYSLDLTFIVDPYVSGGLLAGILVARASRRRAALASLATLAVLVLYMGIKSHFHDRTEEYLRASLDDHIIERVSPMPNDFLRWWFVARNDKELKTGFADLFTHRVYVHGTYPLGNNHPAIERSKETEIVKSFLYFAKHPYAEVEKKGSSNVVKWRELSYAYAPGDRFVATVEMDGEGNLLESGFKY